VSTSFARRVVWTAVAIAAVFAVGTIGFHTLLHESWDAAFYRTALTATLTGLDSQPHGIGSELLTIGLALTGVAIFGYLATQAVEAIAHEVTGHTRRERRERRMIARSAGPVVQRTLAAPLEIPDALLSVEIAESARDCNIDAVPDSIRFHRAKRLDHFLMQRGAELVFLNDVGPRASGQLPFVQHAGIVDEPS